MKIAIPRPWKKSPPLSQQPHSKSWGLVKPPSFLKFSWRLKLPPSPAQRARCILWLKSKIFNYKKSYNKQKYFSVITKNSNWEGLTQNLVTLKNKMALRMKNFNILDIHWKIRLLVGCSRKTNIEGGGLPNWKRGAWTVCWFKGGLVRKRGGTFEGGFDNPMYTILYVYEYFLNNFFLFFINKNVFFCFSILFCDKMSNIHGRILTNQKPE